MASMIDRAEPREIWTTGIAIRCSCSATSASRAAAGTTSFSKTWLPSTALGSFASASRNG